MLRDMCEFGTPRNHKDFIEDYSFQNRNETKWINYGVRERFAAS